MFLYSDRNVCEIKLVASRNILAGEHAFGLIDFELLVYVQNRFGG